MQIIETLHETPVGTANSYDSGQASCELEVSEVASGECGAQPDEQLNSVAEEPADPGLRMRRVHEIQDALSDGTYNVSASEVAARIMSHMLKK